MHLGRKYKFTEYLIWMKRETGYLFVWSLIVTVFLEVTRWSFLSIPAPLLAVIGTAAALILAFKNQQCHARGNEALALWGQINSASMILANKLMATVGKLEAAKPSPLLNELFYRHFAWLTALRFFLRAPKTWENTLEPGNAKFLAALPTPESKSDLKAELAVYFSKEEFEQVVSHPGDKESFILHKQYQSLGELHSKTLISDYVFVSLTNALDDIARLQGAVKRIKSYPYARNYYSIAVILVMAFAAIVPFGFFQNALELGKQDGIEHWTVWLNIPFSVFVGWAFVTLEKVGENSSNPFEGGPNDVPISFLARRIEIEMRTMLGEKTDLKPIEAKYNILF